MRIGRADTSGCRGEQTANALENNLNRLESKLDELLASFEESAKETRTGTDADTQTEGNESDQAEKVSEKAEQDGVQDLPRT